MTVTIDGTVGANKGVVLDSNGKLPVIDGSQVTALSATQVTTGTVATARLDTGTTAGKVMVLDGSGNMPAVSGVLMTGVASATKSASSPTVSTNPSTGLGTKWIKTGTGDIWICTDATAGANVWTNVGGGTGDIEPWAFQGTTYGYAMGGQTPGSPASNSDVERFSFASGTQNSSDVANLLAPNRYNHSVCNTGTAGYLLAGITTPTATVAIKQKFLFSTEANTTNVGNLTTPGEGRSGSNSSTHGYSSGGSTTSGGGQPYKDDIEKFSFAAESASVDVGNLVGGAAYSGGSGANSVLNGYVMGGQTNGSPAPYLNMIQRISFASDGNSTDSGANLTVARNSGSSASSTSYIYYAGGNPTGITIDKYQFDTSNNSTDVGDLIANCWSPGSVTSTAYGYMMGGGSPYQDHIQKWSFATGTQNATDVGNLTSTRYGLAGCHT